MPHRAEFHGMASALLASALDAPFTQRLLTAVVIALISTLASKLLEKILRKVSK